MHLVLCLVGLPLLPLDFGPARGVGVPLGIRLARAGSLLLLLLLWEVEEWELPARCRRPFPASPRLLTLPNSHRTFHDVRIRGSHQSHAPALYPPAIHAPRGVARGRIGGLDHVRVARVDIAVALAPLPVRGQEVVSASLSSRGLSRRERSRSADCYRSRRGSSRSRRDRSRSSERYRSRRDRSRRERTRSPARRGEQRDRSRSHALPSRSHDRSRSGGRLPASPARLRTEEAGRLARRGIQEGVEAVASQPPVVPASAFLGVPPTASLDPSSRSVGAAVPVSSAAHAVPVAQPPPVFDTLVHPSV